MRVGELIKILSALSSDSVVFLGDPGSLYVHEGDENIEITTFSDNEDYPSSGRKFQKGC